MKQIRVHLALYYHSGQQSTRLFCVEMSLENTSYIRHNDGFLSERNPRDKEHLSGSRVCLRAGDDTVIIYTQLESTPRNRST